MRGRDPLLTFLGLFMLVVGVGGAVLLLHPFGGRVLDLDLTRADQVERLVELGVGVAAGVILLHMAKPRR